MFCEYLRYLLLDFKAEPTRILKYLIREMDAEKMKCKGKKGMRIFSYKWKITIMIIYVDDL